MERVLVVAYQPKAGKREELLNLLARQHTHARQLGLLGRQRPILCEATHGEIVCVVILAEGAHIDALFRDETYQDNSARIASIAVVTPLQSVAEASATFMDLAALPLRGG